MIAYTNAYGELSETIELGNQYTHPSKHIFNFASLSIFLSIQLQLVGPIFLGASEDVNLHSFLS
jgi:hypothetical protein